MKIKFLLTFLWASVFTINAQNVLTTTSTFSNNNGSGGVTFNLQNTNSFPVIITGISGVTGTAGACSVEMHYNNTPVSAAPVAINVANGWNLVASASITGVANSTTTVTQPFLTGLNFIIPANTTYGMYVFCTGQRYFTIASGNPTVTSSGLTLTSGNNVGYGGGTPPTAPTINSRGWIGDITFIPAVACSGTPFSGNAISSSNFVCASSSFILSLQNDSIRQNLTYQWLSSSTGLGGSYTVMTNDTTRNVTKTLNAPTWYRCVVACGTSRDTSTAVFVNTSTTPMAGNYTINSTLPVSSTNFNSFQAFVTQINCTGVAGPVTATIAPNTGPYNAGVSFGNITGTSATNTILINGNGNVLQSATVSPVLGFAASRYITLDSCVITGTGSYSGFGIHIGSNSQYVTVRKCRIDMGMTLTSTTSAGIVVSGSTTGATTAGTSGSFLNISNNEIIGGYYGATFIGNTGPVGNYGNTFTNNIVRDFYIYGTYFTNADSCQVTGNDIHRLNRPSVTTFYGIYNSASRNTKFRNNRIHDGGSASYTAYPIYLSNIANTIGMETEFINNAIYNIQTTGTFYGIYSLTTSLTYVNFLHNTIQMDVPSASTGTIRGVFFSVIPTNVNFRNNIISITGAGSGAKHGMYVTTTSTSLRSNYNNIFVSTSAGTASTGYWTADRTTLANWQSNSGLDTNSVSVNPTFVNVLSNNITPTSVVMDNMGTPMGVLTDMNGNSRSTSTPDLGAIEYTAAILCSGTPVSGTAVASTNYACANQLFSLTLSNDTVRAGLRYQWQSSNTGLPGSYTNLPGDTLRTVTESQTSTKWYRCVVTCNTSSDTSVSVSVQTTSTPLSGNYTINPSLPISSTNFQSIVNFNTVISCVGVSGPVVVTVAPNSGTYTGSLSFGNIVGVSAVNRVTLRGNWNTIASASSPIVTFNNTKFFTLDSFQIVGTGGFAGFGINITNQCDNLIIQKNRIDVGTTSTATTNAGLVISGSSSAATTAGNNATNLTITRNEIVGGYYGMTVIGNTGYVGNYGHLITNNIVRDFYLYGIYVLNGDSIQLLNNDVNRALRAGLSTFYGIFKSASRNIKIRNNSIHDAGVGSYTAYPIYIANSANNLGGETDFINNTIYNINTTGTIYGIYSLTTTITNVNFYHNTIHLDIPVGSTGTIRGAFFSVAISNVNFRNNIISITGSGTGAKTGIYVTTTSLSFTSNNNDVFVSTSTGTNSFGYWTADRPLLSDWQLASGMDAASVSLNPVYTNASSDNLVPLSSNIDNLGSNVGVAFDAAGNARSNSTPDLGAFEFTGLSFDVSITSAQIVRSGICYSTNDTFRVTIQNLVGPSINFSSNPLSIVRVITGPVNTTDSMIINTGTLASNATTTFTSVNVNLSQAGTYTMRVYIRPNAINTVLGNDTLANNVQVVVNPILSVTPKTATAVTAQDTFILRANSPLFSGSQFFITEVAHFKTTVGQPAGGWPSYLLADDYIEITGVPGSDLAGITLEQWSTTGITSTYTFPTGTILSPNGTAIVAVGQMGSSVPVPASFYYHGNGTYTGSFGSTGTAGRILRNSSGVIIDAVGYGTYSFPVAAGVTASDWSGNTPAVSSSGNKLNGPDNNTASNWVNSGSVPQNPNIINANVSLPNPTPVTGFSWSLNNVVIDTTQVRVVGRYTVPGLYRYVATYNSACGIFRDTAFITAAGTVPVSLLHFDGVVVANGSLLSWQTASEQNNSHFVVERSVDAKNFNAVSQIKGEGNTSNITSYSYIDENSFSILKTDKLYYRLLQVDFDGTQTYSNMIQLTKNSASLSLDGVSVIPNPSNGSFQIIFQSSNANNVSVTVYAITGAMVWQQGYSAKEGTNTFNINSELPSGVYIISLNDGVNLSTKRICIR